MSADVVPIRKPTPADDAWATYSEIARRMRDDPALMTDRDHVERMIMAFGRFRDEFLRTNK